MSDQAPQPTGTNWQPILGVAAIIGSIVVRRYMPNMPATDQQTIVDFVVHALPDLFTAIGTLLTALSPQLHLGNVPFLQKRP